MKAGGGRRIRSLSEPAKQEVTPSFISNQQGGGLGGVTGQQDVPSTPGRTDRRWTLAGVCSGRIRRWGGGGQKQANNKRQR